MSLNLSIWKHIYSCYKRVTEQVAADDLILSYSNGDMKKIKVDLQNCYGIRSLKHEFDTANGNTFLIYASNGAMKTSLARVFDDIAAGEEPKDLLFPKRKTKCIITDEAGAPLNGAEILVVHPYVENYSSQRTATLMADQGLRQQYEETVRSVEDKASFVLKTLGELSGLKKATKDKLLMSFNETDENLYSLLKSLNANTASAEDLYLAELKYDDILNDKVVAFLSKDNIRKNLMDYISRYNDLIDQSVYFHRGIFNHNHAAAIKKSLDDNGFFNAKHKVLLSTKDNNLKEITTTEELQAAIEEEKHRILNDPTLIKSFEAVDKEITRNAELKQFRSCIEANPQLISELADITLLRKKLWQCYCEKAKDVLAEFTSLYKTAETNIAAIINQARHQETAWQNVLSIFHRRFSVPFSLVLENQHEVILKNQIPSILFKYRDGSDECEVGRDQLVNVLSTGERRALYLLNVIFEIEARTTEEHKTILVLDDIADSFDYKNKYAIVEYIKSIVNSNKFITIILTHNFDFFRTIKMRLGIDRSSCFTAIRSDQGITLSNDLYFNPFKAWREQIRNNRQILLASIPFVRNLIEYQEGNDNDDYKLLTYILHYRPDSKKIQLSNVATIVSRVLRINVDVNTESATDALFKETSKVINDENTMKLEGKVLLSMAIRLRAEELMFLEIGEATVLDSIEANQTRALFNIFCEQCAHKHDTIELIERVLLMTPEVLHLNSFMYEPLLDMTDNHLKNLYHDINQALETYSNQSIAA